MSRSTRDLCAFVLARVDDDRALIDAASEAGAAFVPFSTDALRGNLDAVVALVGDSWQRGSVQGDYVLRYLALPYAHHPDFNPAWREVR